MRKLCREYPHCSLPRCCCCCFFLLLLSSRLLSPPPPTYPPHWLSSNDKIRVLAKVKPMYCLFVPVLYSSWLVYPALESWFKGVLCFCNNTFILIFSADLAYVQELYIFHLRNISKKYQIITGVLLNYVNTI